MSASSKKQLRKEQNLAALTEKQLQEKKESRKLKIYTISFVVVIALIIALGLFLIGRNTVVNSGVMQKTTAVKIGEHKLSAVELNYFYVDYIQETYNYWYETYGNMTDSYVAMLYGLNTAAPLDQQFYDAENQVTWAEFFANQAVKDATAIYAVYDEAVAKGFTLTEEQKASIDYDMQMFQLYASMSKAPTLEDYLVSMYGKGSTEKSFRKYLEINALVEAYYTEYGTSLTYDDADYRAYEAEHYDDFTSYSYAYFYVDADKFLEGGTEGEDDKITYSDEETKASVEAAKAVADALVISEATDSAALKEQIKLIETYKDLNDSEFYVKEDILHTSVSAISNITGDTIRSWLSDDARVAGDKTVFADERTVTAEDGTKTTTTYGYFVMIVDEINENKIDLVNVRHILFGFEGGLTDAEGNTTYSEAEKQAALTKANAVLDTYNAGERTEDAFAALVKDNSDDSGSVNNGGLYEGVYPGQMVEAFNDWCFSEERQPGDVEPIETEYGWHLMYYVGADDMTYRDYMIENTLRNKDVGEWYEALVGSYEAKNVKIKYLNLGYIINASASTTY